METIAIASGVEAAGLKDRIVAYLRNRGLSCSDLSGAQGVAQGFAEFPDYASRVAGAVAGKEAEGGIIIDAFGLGSAVVANKFKGIRASLCTSSTTAFYTRRHNNSNVLCLGAEMLGATKLMDIVEAWISNAFEGGRHAISLGMIAEGEEKQFTGSWWCPDGPRSTEMPVGALFPFKRLYVGCDHAGYEAKLQALQVLEASGIEYMDIGTGSTDIVRYPFYAARVAQAVLSGKADGGILICGTGIGMSIAVNKFKGVRATLCGDATAARVGRKLLDSNILCLGGKIVGAFEAEAILNTWLTTPYATSDTSETLRRIYAIEESQMRRSDWMPASNF